MALKKKELFNDWSEFCDCMTQTSWLDANANLICD